MTEGLNLETKKFIEDLSQEKSDYKYPSQAETQANSLDTLSADIYSESERFIYELIQNADDACADSEKGIEICFEFTNNFFLISHTGKAFTESDIKAICDVGKSTKGDNPNQTGYKGIGFKSVFGKSNYVCIMSNEYCFRFDQEYWRKLYSYKMPWQFIPIWTENLDLAQEIKASYLYNNKQYNVSTAIKYSNTQELSQELSKLLNNTQILLFLRNIKKLEVYNTQLKLEKIKQFEIAIIKKNGNIQSEWIVKNFTGIVIDNHIQSLLEKDDKSPKRLKEANFTNIALAAKIDKEKLVSVNNEAIIFTYLPTKINLGFPCLVNADFLTNAAREGFHEDRDWNQWLFKQVAIKFVEWLAELAKNESYRYQITSLLPEKFTYDINSKIKQSFNKGLDEGLDKIAFIPSQNGTLLKVNEALIDKTGIYKIIGSDVITQYYNQKYQTSLDKNSLVHYQIQSLNNLVALGVKKFNIEKLTDFFNTEIFQINITSSNNYELIKFLYEKCVEKIQNDSWKKIIKDLPFIFNDREQLTTPNAPIYFPSESFNTDLDGLNNYFKFIHKEVLAKILENKNIYNWFCQDLHITQPTQKNIIEKIVIPNIADLSNTNEKSIEIVRYLFDAYRIGQLPEENLQQLSKINLLTKAHTLIPSHNNLYLSNAYKPELPLENYLEESNFVSEKYIREKDNSKEWSLFFSKIEVYDQICILTFEEYYNYSIVNSCHPNYVSYIHSKYISKTVYATYKHQHGFSDIVTATFINYSCRNYNFAKIFWKLLIENKIIEKIQEIKSQYWVWNKSKSFLVTTYLEYFLLTQPCIPTQTGQCYKPNEVIINRQEFKEIGGDFLPILDLDIKLSEELENFLEFRTELHLTDYLNVLSHITEQNHEKKEVPQLIKRIELIYEALVKFDRPFEINQIIDWGNKNKILASDYQFYSPSSLYYITLKHFDSPANIVKFVQFSKPDKRVIELLKRWNVNIIGDEDLTIEKSIDAIETQDLKDRLKSHLPLIALVVAQKYEKQWQTEFEKLSQIVEESRFYQTSELYLKFEQNNQEIFREKHNAGFQKKDFYYTSDWYCPRTLYSLIEELCKFLEIEKLEKELNLLLLDSFDSGLEWLKEQGYNISVIPQNDIVVKDKPIATLSPTYTRNICQIEYDKETGKIGENFVYQELKRIFIKKYQANNDELKKTELGFKLRDIEVVWENKHQESMSKYDFKLIKNHKVIKNNKFRIIKEISYIDSKATTTNEDRSESIAFYLSLQEWAWMLSENSSYYIARVFEARTTNIYMKLIKLEEGLLL